MTLSNGTMVPIQTITVGAGGQAAIEFTNIPQTYTDLVIKYSGRLNANVDPTSKITFNNSTTGYTNRVLYGNGSNAFSFTNTPGYAYGPYLTNSANTATTFSSGEIYIPNYTSSNNKTTSLDNVTETNATEAYQFLSASLWANSAAITTVTLAPINAPFVQHSTATLYGVTSAGYGAKATGGIITSDENYYYHTFLSSGTFTPTQNLTIDHLTIAGGGGGARVGGNGGGGGGAGGYRTSIGGSALSLTANSNYTITVGGGGAGGVGATSNGTQGSTSSISGTGITTITCTGGGYGAVANLTGGNGGSGGGAGTGLSVQTISGGTGTAGEGNDGGDAQSDGIVRLGGGGGGAGAAGGDANLGTTSAGNGGAGLSSSITGSAVTRAGGGGGSLPASSGGNLGIGGSGGGGNASRTTAAGAGTVNTGSGGGSGADGYDGGAGGSGIVIIRYPK